MSDPPFSRLDLICCRNLLIYLDREAQIVWNLLSNALKYTAHVSIDVSPQLDAGNAVLRITDTGSGIDPQQLRHIFNMYQQTRNTSGRRAGLGIGLTPVRELVNVHGGAVHAESEGLGHGASFTVTLPTRWPLFHPASGSPVWAAHVSLNGVRVMMVDVDAATIETFRLLLESEGAIVQTATSGEQALSMLGNGDAPDMVLSELGMPGMDSFQLVDEVRKKQGSKRPARTRSILSRAQTKRQFGSSTEPTNCAPGRAYAIKRMPCRMPYHRVTPRADKFSGSVATIAT
jgi:two-component system CheB/CheR fusion protein